MQSPAEPVSALREPPVAGWHGWPFGGQWVKKNAKTFFVPQTPQNGPKWPQNHSFPHICMFFTHFNVFFWPTPGSPAPIFGHFWKMEKNHPQISIFCVKWPVLGEKQAQIYMVLMNYHWKNHNLASLWHPLMIWRIKFFLVSVTQISGFHGQNFPIFGPTCPPCPNPKIHQAES